jgi:hypothetical protein
MKFKVTIASQPLSNSKGRNGEDVYAAYVSLAGVQVYSTAVSSPGGPTAHEEMRHEVMRGFANELHDVLAEHTL